jgi:hypothetical protein
MLARQRLDNGARFAMRPDGKHNGVVVPFHVFLFISYCHPRATGPHEARPERKLQRGASSERPRAKRVIRRADARRLGSRLRGNDTKGNYSSGYSSPIVL